MSSPVDTIAEHLEANVTALDGWVVYRGVEPNDPDRIVSLFEYPGAPTETTFAADYPNVQVRVRGAAFEYSEPREMAQVVFDLLHAQEVHGTTVSPNEGFVYVIGEGSPYLVDRDTGDRSTFAFTCRTMRSR